MSGTGNVIIIGANEFQLPLIKKAAERGFRTHVFAWEEGAVGREAAAFFYPISIVEKEKILGIARELHPDAVLTIGSDLAEITVNYLANHLALPGNPPETAFLATNKPAMRTAFQEACLYTPRFRKMSLKEEVRPEDFRSWQLPLIVKPVDRSGSRGVTRVDALKDLKTAVENAAELSFSREAIVEEFIDGEEYSCEGISFHGTHQLLQVTAKLTTEAPFYIERGHLEPAGLDDALLTRIREVTFRALDALHIQNGASHTELRIRPDGEFCLIETGARMGGDCIGSHLVPLTTGLDYLGMTLDAALGMPPDFKPTPHRAAAGIRFLMNRRDLYCCRKAERSSPELIAGKYLPEGDGAPIPDIPPSDSASRYGYYIFAGNDPSQIRRLLYESSEAEIL